MEAIVKFLATVGLFTVVFIVYMFTVACLIPKIKEIMKRQTKIRLLCRHEYVQVGLWNDPIKQEYILSCRKCGKRKRIDIYKTEKDIIEIKRN